jgi:proteasome lid subunit RPN8/RPN11
MRVRLTAMAHRALIPLVAAGRHGVERVAFLHGLADPLGVTVAAVSSVANTHRRANGFGVAARDYRTAAASGSLIGLFHTHAGDCRPSDADLALLRRSGLVQIIGAPAEDGSAVTLRALCLRDDGSIDSPPIEVIAP